MCPKCDLGIKEIEEKSGTNPYVGDRTLQILFWCPTHAFAAKSVFLGPSAIGAEACRALGTANLTLWQAEHLLGM